MKKLKIILHYKYIILFIITIIYTYIVITNSFYQSKYDINTHKIYGIITDIKIDGNKVNIELKGKEKIIVYYYLNNKEELELFNSYSLGYEIEVNGILSKPNNNTNFNLFNYRKYLLSKKIYYVMNADNIKIINNKPNILYAVKNSIINKINKYKTRDYLNTFILGDNSFMNEEIINSYQINGISHLFALSGMHVMVFSTILLFIINKIINNKKINYIIVSVLLLFYIFITGFSPSIFRAVLFFIIININKNYQLKIETVNLYLLLVSISLLINPYSIYNNGFLFSYIICFYLILFSEIINRYRNYFVKTLITSFISFLGSLPIMINSYNSINLISFIYNLFYVPFVSCIVFPLSLIVLVFPLFDDVLKIFITILEVTSIELSKVKLFIITLKSISILYIFVYYLLLSFVFIKIKKRKYYYLLLLIIIFVIHKNYNYLNNDFIIDVLDVGQGDSILISYPNNRCNILIDTGGKTSFFKDSWMIRKKQYSISINTIIPVLKSNGISKLDYLIITHGDYDHMGEAINLVENFKVEKVIFNCGSYNDLEQKLIKVLDKKHIKYYTCIKELNIDKNKLYFLQTKEYNNENDNSNVIYTEINGYKFMFMGDASVTTEKEILNKYNLPEIDILKVGHHGSKTSSGKEFISEINPKYSIISVGKNNRYGHPNKEVLENIENSKIYRTDKDGSIMLKIKNNKLKIETCSP